MLLVTKKLLAIIVKKDLFQEATHGPYVEDANEWSSVAKHASKQDGKNTSICFVPTVRYPILTNFT